MLEITSLNNPNIKHIRALDSKKERDKCGEYTVEGRKSVNEAISSNKEILCLVFAESFNSDLILECDTQKFKVSDFILEKISDTKTPPGVLAVIKQEKEELSELKDNGLYLYCDNVSDPGNMGTLIRTADAAGFDGVLLSKGCVELHNPKTVRASMGSFFRMRIYPEVTSEKLIEFKNQGALLYGGALRDDTVDYRKADYKKTSIIVVGNEANGICDEILKICTPVKIPIYGGAESLNVGVAAGILMYEAANSR